MHAARRLLEDGGPDALTMDALAEAGIAITEGPVALGDGYVLHSMRIRSMNDRGPGRRGRGRDAAPASA